MSTEAYRLPDFHASFPNKPGGEINPHFQVVETVFNEWVEKKLSGHAAVEAYANQSPLGAALTYPLASPQQLMGIANFTAVGFLLDDTFDRSRTDDVAIIPKLWMEILRGGFETKNAQHPFVEMMRECSDLLLSTKIAVGTFHWPQFVKENEMMVRGMFEEARDRKVHLNENTAHDIESYLAQRRMSVGTSVFFVFIRVSRSLYIPDDVLAHPAVQGMEDAAAEIIIISNDIYSFKKECNHDSAVCNILTAIAKAPETAHLDFQGRLDHSQKMFNARLERFYAFQRQIPSFGPEMDKYLASYVDGFIDVIDGNVRWSSVVRRYSTFTHDEDRKNNIVKITVENALEKKKNTLVLTWPGYAAQTLSYLFARVYLFFLGAFISRARKGSS